MIDALSLCNGCGLEPSIAASPAGYCERCEYEARHDPLGGSDLGPCSNFAGDALGEKLVCSTCFYHLKDHFERRAGCE